MLCYEMLCYEEIRVSFSECLCCSTLRRGTKRDRETAVHNASPESILKKSRGNVYYHSRVCHVDLKIHSVCAIFEKTLAIVLKIIWEYRIHFFLVCLIIDP